MKREYRKILDNAVRIWHKVAKDHGIKPCNCFRVEFGEWLSSYNKKKRI